MATGKITQVIGTVVDVEFPPEEMPAIFNAVETQIGGQRWCWRSSSTSATTG